MCFLFMILYIALFFIFFFFNDTATTEIYTLSLHDALPICSIELAVELPDLELPELARTAGVQILDRKSTRLNSSHSQISYAVFCLKKKKKPQHPRPTPSLHIAKTHSPAPRALTI